MDAPLQQAMSITIVIFMVGNLLEVGLRLAARSLPDHVRVGRFRHEGLTPAGPPTADTTLTVNTGAGRVE